MMQNCLNYIHSKEDLGGRGDNNACVHAGYVDDKGEMYFGVAKDSKGQRWTGPT